MRKFDDFQKVWKDKAAPLMTKAEIELILNILGRNKQRMHTIVELGCYTGGTTVRIAGMLPATHIYTVDNFTLNGPTIRELAIENFRKYPNIELIEADSKNALSRIPAEIDFLFVDADHQDDNIQLDINNYCPRVRSGGFAAFDDYDNDDFPRVSHRVDQLLAGWKRIGQADTLLILQKP